MIRRRRLLRALTLAILAASFISPLASGAEKSQVPRALSSLPSFADLAESVKPAVVNISTVSTLKIPGNPFQFFFGQNEHDRGQREFDDYLKRFFGDIPDRELKQKSLGSGVIIDKTGYILTNHHVVQRAEEITVRMTDGREFKARVIGRDAKTDLSLIKIPVSGQSLPALPLGDSDKMRVGDWVLAIGNPFGLAHTVTQGIISATGRVIGTGPYDSFLQTDAPVNPGNSGGPLVNLSGEVVGITTAIVATGQGIGFAVPSNIAKNVVAQLRERGRVVRGWIGVSIQEVTPDIAQFFGLKETRGALVGDVVRGGPAEAAGVKRGDIILRFNGNEIKAMSDLPMLVAQAPVGSTARMRVLREGKEVSLPVKVGELAEEKKPAQAGRTTAPEADFGMSLENVTPLLRKQLDMEEETGVVVTEVAQGSPADDAGVKSGDIIKEVNKRPVRSVSDYRAFVREAPKGSPLLLLLKRGKTSLYASFRKP